MDGRAARVVANEDKDVALGGGDDPPVPPLVEVAVEPGFVMEVKENPDDVDDTEADLVVDGPETGVVDIPADPLDVDCPPELIVETVGSSEPEAVPWPDPVTAYPVAHPKDHVGVKGEEIGLPETSEDLMPVDSRAACETARRNVVNVIKRPRRSPIVRIWT